MSDKLTETWTKLTRTHSAASAIAGNTFLRSLAGAGFPLFSSYMFEGMGIQWASTLLGCVAAVLVPIPVIFYLYGHRIRAKSAFAPTPPPEVLDLTRNSGDSDAALEKEVNGGLASYPGRRGTDVV